MSFIPGANGVPSQFPDGINLSTSTAGLALPSGTTAQRPLSPVVGTSRFNTDLKYQEIWTGTEWVINSSNSRITVSLSNNTVNSVYSVAAYNGGELNGYIEINATASYRFTVSAPFVKKGDSSDYFISPSYMGDTPPAGFNISVTSAGLVQLTMPNVTGFSSASINFSLNAPAVGATIPLSIDAGTITSGTIASPRLPAGQYPGNTTGNAIAAGYVGEVKTISGSNTAVAASGAVTNILGGTTGLVLGSGVWLMYGTAIVGHGSGTGFTQEYALISATNNSATQVSTDDSAYVQAANTGNINSRLKVGPTIVVVPASSTQTYYLNGSATYTSAGTAVWAAPNCHLTAIRIA